jgi:hypothetical protein
MSSPGRPHDPELGIYPVEDEDKSVSGPALTEDEAREWRNFDLIRSQPLNWKDLEQWFDPEDVENSALGAEPELPVTMAELPAMVERLLACIIEFDKQDEVIGDLRELHCAWVSKFGPQFARRCVRWHVTRLIGRTALPLLKRLFFAEAIRRLIT